MNYKLLLIWVMFFIGLAYVCGPTQSRLTMEGFEQTGVSRCPNLLLSKNGLFYLYDTGKATVPGVNPAIFESLEEYKLYLDWQKATGQNCPVLHLESGIGAQGSEEVRIKSNGSGPGAMPFWEQPQQQAHVPPIISYNKGDYPSTDNVIGSEIVN